MAASNDLGGAVTGLRVVVAAMILGVVLFAAIALYMAPAEGGEGYGFLVTVSIVVAVSTLAARPIVDRVLVARLADRPLSSESESGGSELIDAYRQRTILRAAMTELPGLLASVAVLLTGSSVALAVAGVMVVALLFELPSEERLHRFAQAATGREPA